jgi:hypothetical protein
MMLGIMRPSFCYFVVKEGFIMKKMFSRVSLMSGAAWLAATAPVFANAPEGGGPPDYSGITALYYVLIGLILAYGVYDTFLKKS